MGYAAAFGALAGAMLIFPLEAAAAAARGLALWATAVVPVLGPFMACMLMVASRVGGGLPARAGLGWLCGSPGGARLMQTIRPRGRVALRGAALSGTMSPMFFLGTVSAWLCDPKAGRMILLCHWLGALALGLLIPGKGETATAKPVPLPLGQALGDTAQALLTVGLCMALGCVAARMAACALPGLPPMAAAGVQCALEVTSGVQALIALHPPGAVPLVCAACSFGGLSLLLQNAAFWRDSGVKLWQLLALRMLHGLIAGLLCFALTGIDGHGIL